MTSFAEIVLAPKEGSAFEMRAGQVIGITAQSGVSLVAFNARDLNERFDQARTKVYNMKLWLDLGDKLFSKLNNPMMTVVEDGFKPYGRHDLQLGHCAGDSADSAAVLRSLTQALAHWNIPAHSIPMPLNAFQSCEIDVVSGAITPVPVPLSSPVTLVLKAEMDLVVAVAECPAASAGNAAPVRIAVVES